ncbi:MAG: hypothetical protein WCH10_05990 [bacterium]
MRENFVSSYTRILFSLLCPETPELRKYALQHSSKKDKSSLTSPLSSAQFQEAYSYSSSIIQQHLETVAVAQSARNTAKTKLDIITDQRSLIETILTELHSRDISDDEIIAELHQQLHTLHASETDIEAILDKFKQELNGANKLLQKHDQEWQLHQEELYKQLITQLKDNDIALNDMEKTELHRSSVTTTNIQEKLNELKRLNVKLPDRLSDFAIIVYSAVAAYLSRTFQQIDDKAVKSVIKKLSIIDEEKDISNKLRSDHSEQYKQISDAIKQLGAQIDQTPVLSSGELQRLEQIKKQAEAPAHIVEETEAYGTGTGADT